MKEKKVKIIRVSESEKKERGITYIEYADVMKIYSKPCKGKKGAGKDLTHNLKKERNDDKSKKDKGLRLMQSLSQT